MIFMKINFKKLNFGQLILVKISKLLPLDMIKLFWS